MNQGREAASLALDRAAAVRALTIATVTVLPGYLLAALALQVSRDLRFGTATLGLLVAIFFLAAAVTSPFMGRAVERLGSDKSVAVSATLCACAMAGLAAAQSLEHLYVALGAAGAANGMSQPASNKLLFGAIPTRRLGLAFGVKQASVPIAALISGLALPTVGLLLGWRWAFGIAAVLTGLFAATQWRTAGRQDRGPSTGRVLLRDGSHPVSTLVTLAVAGFLGAAAAASLATFLILSLVGRGLSPASAGWTYALLSWGTIASRICSGWVVDKRPHLNQSHLMARMLALGAVGYLLMTAGNTAVSVIGAALACVIGWGWTGVFQFVTVTWYRENPAAATGVTQAGVALGAGLGPLVLGFFAERQGYELTWLIAGAASLTAACFVLAAKRVWTDD